MESVGLDMDDLFDVHDEDDDIGAAAAPMPDLDSDMPPMNEGAEEGQEEGGEVDSEVLAKLKDIKGAAKKRVMRPQPKLDPTRLNGDRGLPILVKTFQAIKFKGKGHEASDLKLVMNKMEHWAHRLFPKMTFDEVIGRIEKLGLKREVQTTIKRIRLDMPLADEDFTSEHQENNEAQGFGESNDKNNDEDILDAEAAYDEMVRKEREAMGQQQPEMECLQSPTTQSQRSVGLISPPPAVNVSTHPPSTPSTPAGQSIGQSQGMTPEQKERLESNKLRALEKRAARLGVPVSSLLPPKPPPDVNPQTEETVTQAQNSQSNTEDTSNNLNLSDNTPIQKECSDNHTGVHNEQNSDKHEEKTSKNDVITPEEDMMTEDELLSALDCNMEEVDGNGEDKDLTKNSLSGKNANQLEKAEKDFTPDVNKETGNAKGIDRPKIDVCSEPVMDSALGDNVVSVNPEYASIDTSKSQSVGDSCSDLNLKLSEGNGKEVAQDSLVESESEINIQLPGSGNSGLVTKLDSGYNPDENDSESCKPQKDQGNGNSPSECNEERKGSIEGDDLLLRLSESDTTNTTQEDEDIEKIMSDDNNVETPVSMDTS